MALTDNLAALTPLFLSAPAAVTGDLSLDVISNVSIVAVAWYFYKKTEQKNEKIEGEIREQEARHREEVKEERERYEALLKEQQEKTDANIEKIVILTQQSEERAEARNEALLNKILSM